MTQTGQEESGTEQKPEVVLPTRRNRESPMGGIILIVLGLLFLANNLLPRFDFSDYWPLILVAIGVMLLVRARQRG